MAEPIAMQKLIDASIDSDTLEIAVNGDDSTDVETRLGGVYPTLAKAIKIIIEQGTLDATIFKTKTLMTSSALAESSYALVTDESNPSENGYYQKRGEEWVYLAYNYTGVINQIITDLAGVLDDNIIQKLPADSEWAFALQSDDGVMGVKKNGDIVLPKPPPTVASSAITSYNDTAIFRLADKDGKVVFAIGSDGHTIGNGSDTGATYQSRAIKTENNLKIYQKGTGQNYIEYNIDRIALPLVVGENYGNADHWRIKGCYECSNTLARIRPLTTDGAWELALTETGAADFFGTYHGDDKTTSVAIIVDDNVYQQSNTFDIINFSELRIVQTGQLFKNNTSDLAADYYREHTYSKQGFDLKQSVTWQAAMTIGGYMSMIPIVRKWNDGQITDRGLRVDGSVMTIEDLTNGGFTDVYTVLTAGQYAQIWGTTSGINASLKIISTSSNLTNSRFNFSSKPTYNKLYWAAHGNGTKAVAIGDIWSAHTQFNVTTKN